MTPAPRPRTVTFTKREASVVLDTLVHLTAYTRREMADHLGWSAADIRAWESALAKVDAIAEREQ